MVESFGGQDGPVVCVASRAKKLKGMRSFTRFPIPLETAVCRFQNLDCRGKPRAGFDRSD